MALGPAISAEEPACGPSSCCFPLHPGFTVADQISVASNFPGAGCCGCKGPEAVSNGEGIATQVLDRNLGSGFLDYSS